MTLAQRSAERSAAPANPGADELEFRVRFTRAKGISSLLRAPSNSFRWVGAGTVRFDPRGVLISTKRQLLGFARAHRRLVAASEIRGVYREGNAVRVDLRGGGAHNPFFRFWADSATAAAAIVNLFPTKHTIELDEPQHDTTHRTAPRATRPPILTPLLALALVIPMGWYAAGLIRTHFMTKPVPPTTPPASVIAPVRAPTRPSPGEILLARMELQRFGGRIDGLTTQFSMAFTALQAGTLAQADFADGLEKWLTPQWEVLQRQLESDPPRAGSSAAGVREALIAAAVSWQRALKTYASGLRTRDSRKVLSAFDDVRDAEARQRQAQSVVSELERQQ
jgi:hypothetical protein